MAELADAHGSGPCAARLKGSTPFVGTIFLEWFEKLSEAISGYGISAVHQPSKLVRGVRPPLPAPLGGAKGPGHGNNGLQEPQTQDR